jgi:hypothetical protein
VNEETTLADVFRILTSLRNANPISPASTVRITIELARDGFKIFLFRDNDTVASTEGFVDGRKALASFFSRMKMGITPLIQFLTKDIEERVKTLNDLTSRQAVVQESLTNLHAILGDKPLRPPSPGDPEPSRYNRDPTES